MVVVLAAVLSLQAQVSFAEGFVRTGVVQGGRVPAPRDAVADEIARTGGVVLNSDWRKVKAGADGAFSGIDAGYLATTYDSPEDRIVELDATGHGVVYVNGEPRGGDPYAFGYVRLPIKLRKGTNTFVFGGGRGRVSAKLSPIRSSQQLEPADLTIPDVVLGETADLFGGIVVLNNEDARVSDLRIVTEVDGKTVTTLVPPIQPLSLRKVRFNFHPSQASGKVVVSLYRGQNRVDTTTVEARLRKPTETYKRTFVSNIDGSVQYYGVTPSLKPANTNSLVLTLHGASVEGIGQAQAYAPKNWGWIVAPTNRRPYGFDWEDWGRMDALEVLGIAESTLPHDPRRVYLTGHSMGGHGTWSVGTMYPNRFAAIAPSAGWISFWSYAGGWEPRDATPQEKVLRSAMNASDTLMRQHNLADRGVYILHGDADDNVPVEQARIMKKTLDAWHTDVQAYERPGAGHWWGNECVDWPDIWKLFLARELPANPTTFEFTTPNPAISSTNGFLRVEQLADYGKPGSFQCKNGVVTTSNLAALTVLSDQPLLTVDGTAFQRLSAGTTLFAEGGWHAGKLGEGSKSASNGGPYKQAYCRRMVFVFSTAGTPDQNRWSFAKARYDAETWYYRGNGDVDVRSDAEAAKANLGDRNLVLYGNSDTNRMWASTFGKCPIQVSTKGITVNGTSVPGAASALAFYPDRGRMVAVVAGSSISGMRSTDRLPVFTSGVAFPDYTLFGENLYKLGTKSVFDTGFYSNDWKVKTP